MPPKPFKPPRPSTTTSSKGPGRPRKSDTNTGPSSTTIKRKSTSNNGSITKSKTSSKTKSRRPSAREMGLPSLSPDSSASHPQASQSSNESEEDDPFASQAATATPRTRRRQQAERGMDDDGQEEEEVRREGIPADLLAVILHQCFEKEGTRMSKGANKAVGRYMETFVREAVARCAYAGVERGEDGGTGGGVLEVEDLEKGAPQLLMDF